MGKMLKCVVLFVTVFLLCCMLAQIFEGRKLCEETTFGGNDGGGVKRHGGSVEGGDKSSGNKGHGGSGKDKGRDDNQGRDKSPSDKGDIGSSGDHKGSSGDHKGSSGDDNGEKGSNEGCGCDSEGTVGQGGEPVGTNEGGGAGEGQVDGHKDGGCLIAAGGYVSICGKGVIFSLVILAFGALCIGVYWYRNPQVAAAPPV